MHTIARTAALAALVCAASPLSAQDVDPSADSVQQRLTLRPSYVRDPVQVLIVGTFHFANPGQDMVNPEVDDVRSPRRQAELSAVLDGLARFAPTDVAVERLPTADSAVQARYRALRDGAEPGRSETEQIGMRLALRMGHERVHPVDYRQELAMGAVFEYAAEHQPEIAARVQPVTGFIGELLASLVHERTIGGALLAMNEPTFSDIGHGIYLEMATVGAEGDPIGAQVTSDWYERNLHIFANIARIAEPGDRVVVVIGSGHEALLRHYFEMTPGFEVVPLSNYITP